MLDKVKHLSGRLHLAAYDAGGQMLWQWSARNLIVASGYEAMAQALAGRTGRHIVKVAVGTNGTAPTAADTAITDAVMLDITSIEYPKTGAVRFNFTLGYDDANGMSVREYGLIMADGSLFSRKVRESLEKTADMTISGMWEITM